MARGVDIVDLDLDSRNPVLHPEQRLRGRQGNERQIGIVFIHFGFENADHLHHFNFGDDAQRRHAHRRRHHGQNVAGVCAKGTGEFLAENDPLTLNAGIALSGTRRGAVQINELALREVFLQIGNIGFPVRIDSTDHHAGASLSERQHDLFENERRGILDLGNGFNLLKHAFIILHPTAYQLSDHDMAVGSKDFIAQVLAEPGHHGDHHDQRHDAHRHAAHGNEGDDGNKFLRFAGAEMAPADS